MLAAARRFALVAAMLIGIVASRDHAYPLLF
jgi:hypothetical protein